MKKIGKEEMSDFFSSLQKAIHDNAKEKGWWELFENGKAMPKNPLEVHALIHSEIAEATEQARFEKTLSEIYYENEKPEGEAIELADAVIRCMDYFESRGWNLGHAIAVKMKYNASRSYRHGNKKF